MKYRIRSEGDVDNIINTILDSYSKGEKVAYDLVLPNGWWMYFLATEMEKKRLMLEQLLGSFPPESDSADIAINFTLENHGPTSKTEQGLINQLKEMAEKLYGEVSDEFEDEYLEALENLMKTMFDEEDSDDDYNEGAD